MGTGGEGNGALRGAGVVVTGGGSGIGAATVELLVRHGAQVLVVDRDRDAGAAVAARTGQSFVAADVGSPDDWRLVRSAAEALGGVRYVHLNAGVNSGPQWSPIADLADDRLFGTLAVNLAGPILGVRTLAPLLDGRAGSVLVTASLAALGPFPSDPVYAATKAGVVGFVRSIARELGRRDVRINVLCPTATDTPMVGDADRAWLARAGVPLAGAATMAEAVVACLTHPGTGQVFRCDDDRGARLVPVPQMGD
ncbi:MAG TPA: SDR family oxidoreductase [Acidimicrobiales bacterium]|nr:SDR family oxidoreductase [Acidimicrobiales bacterium]